jgi:hypothetical protein
VRDHPVVLRLVEIRTYLEKLKPIDRKLQYQVRSLHPSHRAPAFRPPPTGPARSTPPARRCCNFQTQPS